MKTLKILLLLGALILSGFSRELQRAEMVVKPIKFNGVIIMNPSGGVTECTPLGEPYPYIAHLRSGWLQGIQSHGGKLNTELSTWEISGCSTNFTNGLNTSQITGVNTVANGDSYSYTCIMTVNIFTNDVILNVTVTSGTGRFEGVTGQMMLTGIHTESGIPISGEGFMTFPK